jgi:23S rRNA pseudouridine2605 synthase
VRVNGEVVREPGTKVDPGRDRIEVDGRRVGREGPRVTVVLHKPAGYVTTVRDPHAERTVMELVGDVGCRVFPVGRLDRDTRGVLLFTNDGDLAQRLLHPSHGVEKVYEVTATGDLGAREVRLLAEGVELEEGVTAPARVWGVSRTAGGVRFRIALREGRKRQVRRMVQAVGGHVVELARIAFGPVTLRGVAEGKWRKLTWRDLAELRAAARSRGEGRSRGRRGPGSAATQGEGESETTRERSGEGASQGAEGRDRRRRRPDPRTAQRTGRARPRGR